MQYEKMEDEHYRISLQVSHRYQRMFGILIIKQSSAINKFHMNTHSVILDFFFAELKRK